MKSNTTGLNDHCSKCMALIYCENNDNTTCMYMYKHMYTWFRKEGGLSQIIFTDP